MSKTWKVLLATLAAGATLPTSCATDARDALVIGFMDGISGVVTDSVGAAVPLADWIAAFWG